MMIVLPSSFGTCRMVFVIMVDIAKEVDQNLEKYVNLIGFLL
jgi:hypothetical protein